MQNSGGSGSNSLVLINRIFLILGLGLSLSEIGIGVRIFTFLSSTKIGAFYVGAFIVVACLLGFLAERNGWAMVTITIFTVLSGIVALIGALIDGISWNMLDHTRACYSPYEGEFYGQSAYYTDAGYCSTATVGDTSVKGYCYCVQASNILCYRYILADDSNSDCGDILDEYTTWLHISTIICSVLVVGITLYTIFLCVGGVSTIIKGGSVNTQPHYEPASAAYAEPLLSPIEGTPVYQDTVIQGTVVGSFPAPQNPAYDPYNNKT